MVGPHHSCLGEDTLRFNCMEHSSFHSYCSTSVPIFLVLRLALVFTLIMLRACLVFFTYVWSALCTLLEIIFESCFKLVDWCWKRVLYL